MVKFEDLECGMALICVDNEGIYENSRLKTIADELLSTDLIINDLNSNTRSIFVSGMWLLQEDDLQYFIVRQYTWKQLLESTQQALKDGLVHKYKIVATKDESYIQITSDHSDVTIHDDSADVGMEYIDTLYVQKFVIQNNYCVLRIRQGDKLKFPHYTATAVSDGIESAPYNYVKVQFRHDDGRTFEIPHRLLVGIEVERNKERGRGV